MKIEFFKHNIGDEEIKAVTKVLRGIFLTTGAEVYKFEELFSRYLRCKHTIALNSATAALHLSLIACGIRQGDEVITTPMSFVATANSILMAGAKPIFVDVEKNTGNINADLIESAVNKKTKAIMPVHLYGQMCDMKKIKKIAQRHKLKIIEDCAHCVEGERDGIRPGQLGDFGCFSFYATKSITCGEGGAVTVDDKNMADLLVKLRLHGITKDAAKRYGKGYKHWDMDVLGWKYNLSNIQAALLINQLKLTEKRRNQREKICKKYEESFASAKNIDFPKIYPGSKSARHLFTIWVNPQRRDKILHELETRGIQVAVNYRAIHLLKYFRDNFRYKKGDFPVAERIGSSTISLPLYSKLSSNQISYIIKTVLETAG